MVLAHYRGGSGPRLLLLHGIGSRWQLWRPLLPALEAHFEVLAVDLPGFGATPLDGSTAAAATPAGGEGASAAPSGGAEAAGAAAAAGGAGAGGVGTRLSVEGLADVVEAFAGGRCHVAGSSMGGGVALELGRRGAARSVTAFSPIGFWGPLSRRWCQASVTAARACARTLRPALPALASTAAGRIALFGLFFGHPSRVDPAEGLADAEALAAAPGFRAARAAFAQHRFAGAGALPGIPVTVAWGSRDAVLPAFQARRAARLLPSARHAALPGCGHLPFADDPAACAALIADTARG